MSRNSDSIDISTPRALVVPLRRRVLPRPSYTAQVSTTLPGSIVPGRTYILHPIKTVSIASRDETPNCCCHPRLRLGCLHFHHFAFGWNLIVSFLWLVYRVARGREGWHAWERCDVLPHMREPKRRTWSRLITVGYIIRCEISRSAAILNYVPRESNSFLPSPSTLSSYRIAFP